MNIIGLQGSPRKNGNTHDLLSMFMEEAKKYGSVTETITPHTLDIHPCRELVLCEKKGVCPIKDDMNKNIYSMIKNADLIVLASPLFFYNVPAQTKALIDRCQMFWGRKYKLNLHDPREQIRQGFLLSCGASGGKKLFQGIELTAKVFFDAISAKYNGKLTYRHIESPGQMAAHPTVKKDIQQAVKTLCSDHLSKLSILFLSQKNGCRSQMAAEFFNFHAKGDYNVVSAGFDIQKDICADTIKIMEEKHLDLAYLSPTPLNQISPGLHFNIIIYIGNKPEKLNIKATDTVVWDIEAPKVKSLESLRLIRDELENKVLDCISKLKNKAF
jgi:arsenite transporter/arsenate reductase (thioredoxin)